MFNLAATNVILPAYGRLLSPPTIKVKWYDQHYEISFVMEQQEVRSSTDANQLALGILKIPYK